MHAIKKLPLFITLVTVGLILSYAILYISQENAKNISLDLYELYVTINDNGTIKYRATLRVDNFFGKQFKVAYLLFSINNIILNYDSITLLPKNCSAYILFNGTADNRQLIEAVENFEKLDVRIKIKVCNEEDISFQGNYSRALRLYLKDGKNNYYFTKFDMFGINA